MSMAHLRYKCKFTYHIKKESIIYFCSYVNVLRQSTSVTDGSILSPGHVLLIAVVTKGSNATT